MLTTPVKVNVVDSIKLTNFEYLLFIIARYIVKLWMLSHSGKFLNAKHMRELIANMPSIRVK